MQLGKVVPRLQLLTYSVNGFSRLFSTSSQCRSNPIKMSYASYESTEVNSKAESPVIIMHGLLGNKMNFHSLAKQIQRRTGRKVFSVDARNHGDSEHSSEHTYPLLAEDLLHFLDIMNIKKATLLGHSMGGRAVMLTAVQRPSLIDRLIVVDVSPTSRPLNMDDMEHMLVAMNEIKFPEGIALSKARKAADMQLLPVVKDLMTRQFLLTNLVEENNSIHWRCNIETLTREFAESIAHFQVHGQFGGKTLFVVGALSPYVTEEDHSEIHQMFPSVKIVTVDGAGHWVHAEKPDAFLNAVCSFLKEK